MLAKTINTGTASRTGRQLQQFPAVALVLRANQRIGDEHPQADLVDGNEAAVEQRVQIGAASSALKQITEG